MALVSDDGIFVGEAAVQMSRAYKASGQLSRLGIENAGDSLYWQADYRQSCAWLRVQLREDAGRAVIATLAASGIASEADLRLEKESGFVEADSKYTHRIEIELAQLDLQKLDALVLSRSPQAVETSQPIRVGAPLRLKR